MNQMRDALSNAGVNPQDTERQVFELAGSFPRPKIEGKDNPEYAPAVTEIRKLWNQLPEGKRGFLSWREEQDVLKGDHDPDTLFALKIADGKRHEAFRVVAFRNALQPLTTTGSHNLECLKRGIARETGSGKFAYNVTNAAGQALITYLTELGEEKAAADLQRFFDRLERGRRERDEKVALRKYREEQAAKQAAAKTAAEAPSEEPSTETVETSTETEEPTSSIFDFLNEALSGMKAESRKATMTFIETTYRNPGSVAKMRVKVLITDVKDSGISGFGDARAKSVIEAAAQATT